MNHKGLLLLIVLLSFFFLTSCTNEEQQEQEQTIQFDGKTYTLSEATVNDTNNGYENLYTTSEGEKLTLIYNSFYKDYQVVLNQQVYMVSTSEIGYQVIFPNNQIEYCQGKNAYTCERINDISNDEEIYPESRDFRFVYSVPSDWTEQTIEEQDDSRDGYYVIFAIIMIIIGILNFFYTRAMWDWNHRFKKWMYKNYKPTEGALLFGKVIGAITFFIGVIIFITVLI